MSTRSSKFQNKIPKLETGLRVYATKKLKSYRNTQSDQNPTSNSDLEFNITKKKESNGMENLDNCSELECEEGDNYVMRKGRADEKGNVLTRRMQWWRRRVVASLSSSSRLIKWWCLKEAGCNREEKEIGNVWRMKI
ncbi:hypothetical protein L1887_03746 [Cichorium endivia]|nr:hypothetical protein L1887_03746 [Cichorium endivia]